MTGNAGKRRLTFFFVLLNFIINFIALLLLWGIGAALVHSGIVHYVPNSRSSRVMVIAILSVSHLISCSFVATILSRWSLIPINKTVDAMNELEKGNFDTRMDMRRTKYGAKFANSFNRLAEELENTEMLRSDFINNFSHEFKTPIVSILGFSRLLKKGACTQEEQQEYLNIIEEESLRLTQMATNVLNMTKIENTTILTGTSDYNLSEQIRSALLLLEKRWSEKNLELNIDFNEYEITANEELMKEVWINLLDNAIKFTPVNGEITIHVMQDTANTTVQIANTGQPIPPQDLERIFGKFYQGDTSHASKGTGLGLSIVKKIVELHHGQIQVTSDVHRTTFTVMLPR